jgi:hypothetical protein
MVERPSLYSTRASKHRRESTNRTFGRREKKYVPNKLDIWKEKENYVPRVKIPPCGSAPA